MILPQSYLAALWLMILATICLGSWANSFKLGGKRRFELFYWDFVLGAMAAATVIALTFGSLGFDGFLFRDDLVRAGRRSIAYAAASGVIFNLGNMLLIAAVSVSGLSVAFPIGMGVAVIVGMASRKAIEPQGNGTMLLTGAVIVLAAVVIIAYASRRLELARSRRTIRTGKSKSTLPKASWKGIVVSVIGGGLLGSFFPLLKISETGDAGLGPYAATFVFAAGAFFSTFIFNLLFMNLPVQGEPLEMREYLRVSLKQHAFGILGGVLWVCGMVASQVVAYAPETRLSPAFIYGLDAGAPVLAGLWGLAVWKEFHDDEPAGRIKMGLALILFAGGVALGSIAKLYP